MTGEAVQLQIWKQRMEEIQLRLRDAKRLSPMDYDGLKAEYREIEQLVRTLST